MLTSPLIELILEPEVVQLVKNLPAMQATCVRSLGWEDPWEKEMATQSNTRPGAFISWIDEDRLSPWNCKESGHNCATFIFFHVRVPTREVPNQN